MTVPHQKRRLLHIVANYPDGVFRQITTDAVKNLLEATSDSCDHFVVSIARTADPRNEYVVRGDKLLSVSYLGLPAAIGQSLFLNRLANRIAKELDALNVEYDLIHGHKLTVEGLVAQQLSNERRVPYVCTVRGFTDGKLLRWRPDRRGLYASVLEQASEVFLPAPWTRRLIDKHLNPDQPSWHSRIHYTLLPNIVDFSPLAAAAPENTDQPRFVTVFRAGQGKQKGFKGLLAALAVARTTQKTILLDVIGCGADSEEASWTQQMKLAGQVRFLGRLPNDETVKRIAQYQGFLLPTRHETFGMVYIEALMAGVPVLYSGGTGIDGYLDDLDIGIRVDPFDQDSISQGVIEFSNIAQKLRGNLLDCLNEGKLDFFRRNAIAKTYSEQISQLFQP